MPRLIEWWLATSEPFQCVGDVCGYLTQQYVATHENEWNGVLYSDSEWTQFIIGLVDEQRKALATAIWERILQANPGSTITWQYVYDKLRPAGVQGGNADFARTGEAALIGFIPRSSKGECELTCRVGSFPSIHMNHWDIHLDTANPMQGFGLGFFVHFAVDMILGNINGSVPFQW
ncbi:MAG TPA: hypothetical protein VJP02_04350 [Candidatus Sulfotelmatobacter sp.]|nr:hypothetical protein [Candidatus Sulfotelmatobacter sp.]